MLKNDLLHLHCDNLGAEMEGVCRHEGMAVFVPGLLPGEKADVRIVKVQPRFAFGRVEGEVSSPSPDRRAPDCPVYPRCGGCSARHMSYEATLRAKRQQVEDVFRRIGGVTDVPVPPVIGMESPSQYRNKTALPVGGTREAPEAGFYAPRSHRIIPAAHCPNAMAPSGVLTEVLLGWMQENGIAPYDEETGHGLVRHIVIRVNRLGEAMVTVVIAADRLPREKELAAKLTAAGAVSVYLNVNKARTNVIFGQDFRLLSGSRTLTDTLCGLTFDLAPAAFLQVNPLQAERLYETALSFAGLKDTDTAADVYCGAGTISLLLARHCARVTGIESVAAAIDNANGNAQRNGIRNADFRCGAAEEVLPKMVDEGYRPDVIVVDPPRKGLEKPVIDAMAKAAPRRIVYVSCNPATQARDAALLRENGYRLTAMQPVDMFCYTSGVENVAVFVPV